MKDTLNLQALKRSKNPKHRTIYEKAHRIMQRGWETKEHTEEEILKIASRYPSLDVHVRIGGDIIVRSKKDTWIIKDEVRFFTLYHKGTIFSNGRIRDKYHVQDVFYDLEFIFASIESHDDYTLGITERTTNDILFMIKQRKASQQALAQ
jgi:hypothetical protein